MICALWIIVVIEVEINGHRNVGGIWVGWQISLCFYKRWEVFV